MKATRVYAGLANGTVVVVSNGSNEDPQSNVEVNLILEDESDERIKKEANRWRLLQVSY